jgi:hypothetical protein
VAQRSIKLEQLFSEHSRTARLCLAEASEDGVESLRTCRHRAGVFEQLRGTQPDSREEGVLRFRRLGE